MNSEIEQLGNLSFLQASATIGLAMTLVALVRIDLRDLRLPDRITLPLIGVGLILAAVEGRGWPVEAAIGAAVGYGTFWLIGTVYFRLRRRDGLGLGDAKLLAAAGAWLGPYALPWVVLIGATLALGFAVATAKGRQVPLAFGPWLALGFWAMWIIGLTAGR